MTLGASIYGPNSNQLVGGGAIKECFACLGIHNEYITVLCVYQEWLLLLGRRRVVDGSKSWSFGSR